MQRFYAAVFAAIGWFAVFGQFLTSHADSVASTINYLSYFTIFSNILVATTLTAAALAPRSSLGRFLLRPTTATAGALYITVTGIVFYVILSRLYHLEGWTLIFDHLLHYVMPPAYVLFWLVFIPKGTLHLRNVPGFLVFPLAYAAWTLIHGPLSGFYPYPFVDVPKLGYPRVFLNIVEFVIFFSLVGSCYVLVDRLIHHFSRDARAAAAHSS